MISLLFENIATAIESFIVIISVSTICGLSYTGKKKISFILVGTLLLTILVSVLNYLSAFSYLTIILAMALAATYPFVVHRGSLIHCVTAAVFVYLIIHSIDYTTFFVTGIIFEKPINDFYSFEDLLNPGPVRYIFLLFDKGTDILVYLAMRKQFVKLHSLKKKHYLFLLSISTIAYILMSQLLQMVLSQSLLTMQFAVVTSWIFIMVCVLTQLMVLVLSDSYHREREINNYLHTANTLIEKNYQQYSDNLKLIRDLQHNFNHHLSAIRELSRGDGNEEISRYIDALLPTVKSGTEISKSGNLIVDAIINQKSVQARTDRIQFSYWVDTKVSESINPVDICAILANQVDNAFEACSQIQDINKREVKVHIWQQTESVVIFQVSNTVLVNPFEDNRELKTTKTDRSRPHGLGIQNIRTTAEKYDGYLENTFKKGWFVSTVYLTFN